MELSRPFSDRSPTPARYLGIGLVVALHLAGIYALSAGLIQPLAKAREVTILLPKLIDKPPEPPAPPQPFRPDRPTLTPLRVPDVPVPLTWTDAPTLTAQPMDSDQSPVAAGPVAAGPVTQAPPVRQEGVVRTPGAVCSVMPRPEVPAVNWSGEAVLQAMATVRGGRVVGSELRVLQGALDARSRRALQRSVETALAAYQCQGDAVFQQDFAFRLD